MPRGATYATRPVWMGSADAGVCEKGVAARGGLALVEARIHSLCQYVPIAITGNLAISDEFDHRL